MQSLETYRAMLEHLRFFLVSGFFNVGVWIVWFCVYLFGWVVGMSMQGKRIGSVLIALYFIAAILGFVQRSQGWDAIIIMGFPVALGLYVGKKER